jgi:hypothetical protein
MPTIRRKPVGAYVDEIQDNITGICHMCYEKGIEVVLIPYLMANGKRDDDYCRCPTCSSIIPKLITKHKTIEGPLGKVQGIDKPAFEVITSRRKVRPDKRKMDDIKQDIPKLANQRDRDLEHMVNDGAIIVGIEDTVIEE